MPEINVTQADREEFADFMESGVRELPEHFSNDGVKVVITELIRKYNFSRSFIGALYVLTKALNATQKKFDAANRA